MNSENVLQVGTFKRAKWGLNKNVGSNDVCLYKPNERDNISWNNINKLLGNKCGFTYIKTTLQNTQVISIN